MTFRTFLQLAKELDDLNLAHIAVMWRFAHRQTEQDAEVSKKVVFVDFKKKRAR